MKLREYLPSKDFDNIKSWIDDERTHAMWCADRFEYPLEKENFEALHLNVFSENIRAKKCYQKAGFTERSVAENAFSYKDESWGRCNMFKMLNGMIREVKREEISLCANIIKKSFKTGQTCS